MFGLMHACHLDTSAMIEEFLLKPPFGEKGGFLWLVGVCSILWVSRVSRIVLLEWKGTLGRFCTSFAFMFHCSLQFLSLFVTIL